MSEIKMNPCIVICKMSQHTKEIKKCIHKTCGSESVRLPFVDGDDMSIINSVADRYVCVYSPAHVFYVCKFPDCGENISAEYSTAKVKIIGHVLCIHHKIPISALNDEISAEIFLEDNFGININISDVLIFIPQILVMSCENTLKSVVKELFADLIPEINANLGKGWRGRLHVRYDCMSFFELIDALKMLNYSCVFCGDEYDAMPEASHACSEHL